jgi:hypothetical protein
MLSQATIKSVPLSSLLYSVFINFKYHILL